MMSVIDWFLGLNYNQFMLLWLFGALVAWLSTAWRGNRIDDAESQMGIAIYGLFSIYILVCWMAYLFSSALWWVAG